MAATQPVLPLNVALPVNNLLPIVFIAILAFSSILAVFILAFVLDALLIML